MTQFANTQTQPVLHVRLAGQSAELPLARLDLDLASSDARIKEAVARHFEHPVAFLDDYVVVRHEHSIVVRPEAVYG